REPPREPRRGAGRAGGTGAAGGARGGAAAGPAGGPLMASILVTLDDISTAVPVNAALEAAGHRTAALSPLDDARAALRRGPELLVLTGGVHEPQGHALVAAAREAGVSTLVLLEPTDSERSSRV